MLESYTYMDTMPTHEVPHNEWEQVTEAFGTFGGDLALVRHETTPKISPFGPTNGIITHDGHEERQYNLTSIPTGMTEQQFLDEFKKRKVIKIGCMDRDASGPFYEQLPQKEKDNLTQILTAGGGVQFEEERWKALQTILTYLAKHGEHIEQIFYTGHDHGCGYVASRNGKDKQPIYKDLGTPPCSDPEKTAMKILMKRTADKIGLEELFPGKVVYALEDIDRQGNVTLDDQGFHEVNLQNHPDVARILERFDTIS